MRPLTSQSKLNFRFSSPNRQFSATCAIRESQLESSTFRSPQVKLRRKLVTSNFSSIQKLESYELQVNQLQSQNTGKYKKFLTYEQKMRVRELNLAAFLPKEPNYSFDGYLSSFMLKKRVCSAQIDKRRLISLFQNGKHIYLKIIRQQIELKQSQPVKFQEKPSILVTEEYLQYKKLKSTKSKNIPKW